ncbi:hypothetical protein [Thiohalorhabdus sp.]|uniref:hypothetical protein n=1 Tax=Thiohalorhabdus sp. TaxID=3094134 RepID=UPI002FC3A64C
MDEILNSLRNILEEEGSEDSSGRSESVADQYAPAGEEAPAEGTGEGGEELVLTDVVAEEETAQDPEETIQTGLDRQQESEQDAGIAPPDETAGSEFDALFGRWDREASPAEETEPETGSVAEPEGSAETEPELSPETAPPPEELELGTGAEPAMAEEAFDLSESEAAPAWEAGTESPDQSLAPPSEPPSPAIDSESVRDTVETTVREQVEQATADLDNRLAEALEPKIREALQEYLEERLPGLLREIAETEIERIKKGE